MLGQFRAEVITESELVPILRMVLLSHEEDIKRIAVNSMTQPL